MQKNRYFSVLQTLVSHRVDFIVVGGVAAVLRGAPISTFDLDVVHSTEPDNVVRLLAAMLNLDACYRFQPERLLRPDTTHLSSAGHPLLMTRFGPVDLLGAIGKGRSYADLLHGSAELDLGEGVCVRVLGLDTQIAVKEETGGEKDLAALPVLRRTREESRRSE
jgi:hypothetical protein